MDSSDALDIQDQVDQTIPSSTIWETRTNFCGIKYSYVPSLKQSFFRHWEISPCMPVTVLSIIWSSYSVFVCNFFFALKWSYFTFFLITLFIIFYTVSYINIILEGPGYLPFYYPEKSPTVNNKKENIETSYQNHKDSKNRSHQAHQTNGKRHQIGQDDHNCQFEVNLKGEKDYLSGLAVTKEQIEYAKSHIKVPDTHFFKSARRVVIRPDHFCEWCACFIGRRNYKLFFLFNFWGSIYVSFFMVSCFMGFSESTKQESPKVALMVLNMFYLLIAIFFLLFQGFFMFCCISDILKDTREFEGLTKTKRESNKSFMELLEEVFGPRNKFYLWLIPIGAYCGMDDSDLVVGFGGKNGMSNPGNEDTQWLL
ncbi:DHHC zinc finger domain containing protein [Tritrichomonas foetus]|uniref:Palmitoyltransferase n=1 Tax=Tritrichomonas foetus TaxID=1144522 RepID=A0A1J4JN14_9EUKA|nr:DHHC zinc finger domain containing protein [Tritrichomonas foetus]|eukprot:OHS98644.1 DHHC zinc finger domain containing protein [Tritrichomonas foetus]